MRRVPHPADDDAPEGRPIYQSRAFASFTIALNILPNLNVGAVEAAQRCVGARVSGGALPPTPQHRAARPAHAWNVHRLVGLRVAPLTRLTLLRVERPEVNQRDLVAVCDRLDDDVQRCRARRCATLGTRVGQGWSRASQSSAVQAGQAHERCRRGGVVCCGGGGLCCAGRLGSRSELAVRARGATHLYSAPARPSSSRRLP